MCLDASAASLFYSLSLIVSVRAKWSCVQSINQSHRMLSDMSRACASRVSSFSKLTHCRIESCGFCDSYISFSTPLSSLVSPCQPSAGPPAAAADLFRAYFMQLRQETAKRMFERVFDENGVANKFWVAFSKKKFMVRFMPYSAGCVYPAFYMSSLHWPLSHVLTQFLYFLYLCSFHHPCANALTEHCHRIMFRLACDFERASLPFLPCFSLFP